MGREYFTNFANKKNDPNKTTSNEKGYYENDRK
jgi:hypothetical protein